MTDAVNYASIQAMTDAVNYASIQAMTDAVNEAKKRIHVEFFIMAWDASRTGSSRLRPRPLSAAFT